MNNSFPWSEVKPSAKDVSEGNFRIGGVTLDDAPFFEQVENRFGNAQSVSRGDASTGREQICYSSSDDSDIHLIFEQGEVQFSFYLLADGPSWGGSDLCVKSPLVSKKLKTGVGLQLGMTPSQVEAVLGKADINEHNIIRYIRQLPKKTPPEQLAQFRNDHSYMSEKDFHANYDFYTLSVYVEARFADSKLKYLVVSKSETF